MNRILIYITLLFLFLSLKQNVQPVNNLPENDSLEVKKQHELGSSEYKKGNLENAIDFFNSALKHAPLENRNDSLLYADILMDEGIALFQIGKYKQGEIAFQKTEDIVTKLYASNDIKLGKFYLNKGNMYRRLKNYHEAIRYTEIALSIFKEQFHSSLIAQGYNNLAITYMNIDEYQKALENQKKSLQVKQILFNDKPELSIELGNTYLNIAILYSKLNHISKTDAYFTKTIRYYQKYYTPNYYKLGNVYYSYAKHLQRIKQYEQACVFLRKALDINKVNYTKNPRIAKCYLELGNISLLHHKPEEALTFYQEAVMSLITSKPDVSIREVPKTETCISDIDLAQALTYKAIAMYEVAIVEKNKTDKIEHLKSCITHFDTIYSLLHRIRVSYQNTESKYYLAEQQKITYSRGIQATKALYEITREKQYLAKTFEFIEKGKAAILLTSIKDVKAKQFAGIPEHLIQNEKHLKHELSRYKSRLNTEKQKKDPDREKIQIYQNKIFVLNQHLNKTLQIYQDSFPRYYQMLYENKVVSLNKLQNKLLPGQAVISYFDANYHDKNLPACNSQHELYILAATKHTTELKVISIDSIFTQNFSTIQQLLTPQVFEISANKAYLDFIQSSGYLYRKLIKPVEHVINGKRITIIPDEALAYLPFGVLLTENVIYHHQQQNYSKLPYLIKKNALNYSVSATIQFDFCAKRQYQSNRLLAIAPDYNGYLNLPDTGKFLALRDFHNLLTPIDGSKDEVEQIALLTNGDKLLGSKATEYNFKKSAGKYGIIHVASHTILNQNDPMYSKLAFSLTNDNNEDGLLNTYEIFDLKLRANLVVLSACKTGFGKLQHGEGVISLARSFMYSGVPSIVMTLWSIEDKSSANVMVDFYRFLNSEKPKDIALQEAKISYLNHADPLNAHPFFWSGYVSIGDVSPIKLNNSKTPPKPLYLLYIAIAIILPSTIIIIRRLKK